MEIDVTEHLGLVRTIVAEFRYDRRSFEFADLVQYGVVGLLRAARRFDPSRGVPFTAYARFYVRDSVIRALRSYNLTIRLPDHVLKTGERGPTRNTPEYMDMCEIEEDFVARLATEEEAEWVRRKVEKLRPRERQVIKARYGIGREPATFAKLAAEMGCCRATIRDVELRAERNLRSLLGDGA